MWLSLVEHSVRDAGVGGSNPLIPTTSSLSGIKVWSVIGINPAQPEGRNGLWIPILHLPKEPKNENSETK